MRPPSTVFMAARSDSSSSMSLIGWEWQEFCEDRGPDWSELPLVRPEAMPGCRYLGAPRGERWLGEFPGTESSRTGHQNPGWKDPICGCWASVSLAQGLGRATRPHRRQTGSDDEVPRVQQHRDRTSGKRGRTRGHRVSLIRPALFLEAMPRRSWHPGSFPLGS